MTDAERGHGRRIGATLALVSLLSVGALTPTALAEGDETAPATTVEVVAVGLPPVPPTTTIVAVGQPPVPPTTTIVAVGRPPVPPTTQAASVAVQPATIANRPAAQVAPAELRVSHAAQAVAARLGQLLELLP